jgi:predicted nuclease of predicted toxin-antitoxin system
VELYKFLKKLKINVILAAKGSTNGELAKLSLSQKRVVVTNDEDFSKMSEREIFGVIWLKIPQDNPQLLVKKFSELLKREKLELKGKLVILHPDKIEIFSL